MHEVSLFYTSDSLFIQIIFPCIDSLRAYYDGEKDTQPEITNFFWTRRFAAADISGKIVQCSAVLCVLLEDFQGILGGDQEIRIILGYPKVYRGINIILVHVCHF